MFTLLSRHNRFPVCGISIVCVMLCVPSVMAQSAAPTSQATSRVLITGSGGEPAIARDQLTAFVDARPAEVQDVVSARNEPLVFAILLDISKSGKDKASFETTSAIDLFRALAVGRNSAFFGDFNDELWLTDKPASLDTVLKELEDTRTFRGGTALYDAVLVAARRVNEAAKDTNSRRAVFVFTDGNDNASKFSLNQVIPALQRERVPVFGIGLVQKHPPERAVYALRMMSDSTAGVAHFITGRTEFVPALVSEVENQYWLTISSPALRDGRMHSLVVKSDKRLRISAPSAVLVHPPEDRAGQLQQARQSLTGEHKDTETARKLLLEIVQGGKAWGNAETLVWADIYLGYIEDRANNRQSAISWYEKALTVQGAPSGSLEVAKFGIRKPLVWIRHLDTVTEPPDNER